MRKFLIEITTEELPAIPFLKEEPNIKDKLEVVLKANNIEFSNLEFLYTPRRFVFTFKANERANDSVIELIGAPKEVAYKDGKLSKAGESFLAKADISENELSFKEIKGKVCLYVEKIEKGKLFSELINDILESFITSLNFGKSMRWGTNTFSFIRPITGLCVMMDDELINASLFNINSSKSTFVHRNISMDKISFNTQDEYFKTLKEGKVILNPKDRLEIILSEIRNIEKLWNLKAEIDEELLAEVVAITEYPSALLGSFDKEFLQVAPEVIITSMKENQRYFAVYKDNSLSNNFITITNSFNPDLETIKKGNEKVLRARLSDALFFWENDLKLGLQPELLNNTIYMQELGTIAQKEQREEEIALRLAKLFAYENTKNIKDAILLSKADLRTQMVGEFPELQGIVGSYYAANMGYSSEVCTAIKEQYLYDVIPSTKLSKIVILATRLDTLMALFSINKLPSGNKDPYALRRAALSIIKILIDLGVKFNLLDLLNEFKGLYKDYDKVKLLNFITDRFNALYSVNSSFIKAVLNVNNNDLVVIDENIKALINLAKDKDYESKISTFKRLANIIKDSKDLYCDESKLSNEYEIKLYKAYKDISFSDDVSDNLGKIFALKPIIDEFFDNVMINVDDLEIKNNRLALVYSIYKHIACVADLKEVSFDSIV
ncbi:glycine--tRNA ligase subunit beta [Campylobacter sp. 2018MI01]|uniref:glycine--tRNA ligase subunit beta n=1 Tax=Campylobacter sp. 2018MI01 TaxID=2836735 RepID=UPI001BD96795|nr:glycine--tRNA ligase subunit beta [Campylobacter sp. 2018MI01]MBT0879324.1 glycine--tRNA ligase subunit beta [Campylobacter sp. 2018MI01]